MALQFIREKISQGVHFTSLIDKKFKLNLLSINLIAPLNIETASRYALIPFVLRKGSRALPDFTQLNRRLAELYGAVLDADIRKIGELQVMNLSLATIDDKHSLRNENLTDQLGELGASLLFDPKVDENGFGEQDVCLEKRFLCDTIESEINDKRSFAVKRLKALMCAGEAYGINKYGTVDRVEKITPGDLLAAYRELLSSCTVEIIFSGCGKPKNIKTIFAEAFSRIERSVPPLPSTVVIGKAKECKTYTEKMDVIQSKLCLGFRCDVSEKTLPAYRLFTALYGGTPVSKLFLNVREKRSLCYYCATRLDRHKGVLIVDCGIENANYEAAKQEILSQLEEIRAGNFTQEELQSAALALCNSYKTIPDSVSMLESFYLSGILAGNPVHPEKEVEQILHVTREEVIEAAKNTTLDSIYFLTGN